MPWLGEVPEHWEVLPLKRVAWFKSGAGFPVEDQGASDLGIPFLKVSDMTKPGNERWVEIGANTVSREKAKMLGAHIFPAETIIFPKVGGAMLTNKRRILRIPSCIDNNTMGCVVQKCLVDFAFITLQQLDFGRLSKPGPVPAIGDAEVREIRVALPPRAEQSAIIRFLDHADRRIRRYVRAKRKLIRSLEEQKRAIIHQAVTRGLDRSVRLRPSGVEWLGNVPEHWNVRRLKTLIAKAVAGPYGSSLTKAMYTTSGYRVYGQQQVIPDDFSVGDYYISSEKYDEMQQYVVSPGDVLVSVMGTVGRVAVVPDNVEPGIILAYPVNADTHYMLGAPNRRSRVQRRSAPQPRPRSPAMI